MWRLVAAYMNKGNMRRPSEPDDSHTAIGDGKHYNDKAGHIQPQLYYMTQIQKVHVNAT